MKRFLFLILPVTLLWALPVFADGMYVSNMHVHLEEPIQKAIVIWDGRKETMILSAAVKSSDLANFAWIVPIQSKTNPNVSKADINIFKELVKYFGRDKPSYASGKGELSIKGVEVVESKEIDIYDVTILKATNTNDLLKWLSRNEYMTPPGISSVLKKYVHGVEKKTFVFNGLHSYSSYFVANKVDLRNKYQKEIKEVRRIFSKHEILYNKLCSEINKVLGSYGIQEKMGSEPYTSNQYMEVLGVIHNAVHDPANPFNLPRKWSVDLGEGVSVVEICSAQPYFKDKRIRFRRSEGHKWAMAVYLNGSFVDVIDYDRYTKEESFHKHYSSSIITRRNNLSKFTHKETRLLKKYIEHRDDYHIVTKERVQCDEKLKDLTRELNSVFGSKLWDLRRLGIDLFQEMGMLNKPKVFSKDKIPLYSKIMAAYSMVNTRQEKQYIAPLVSAIQLLQNGMSTPLQFEFQPPKPTYPLHISSLNKGISRIEVYVLADKPAIDGSNMLHVDEVKKIPFQLKKSLAEYIPVVKAKYVTRLYYQGALNDLSDDAIFQENPNALTEKQKIKEKEQSQRELKIRLAKDSGTPLPVLAVLANDTNKDIRFEVAGNPSASGGILRLLASDSYRDVRHNVAKNRSTLPEVLNSLASDPCEEVRWEVVMNPNCPSTALEILSKSKSSKMKLMVVNHGNRSIRVLRKLVNDDDPKVADAAMIVLERLRKSSE